MRPTRTGHGRTRDLVIGVVGLGYAVWLVYAGGWEYLLVAGGVLPRRHRALRVGPQGEPRLPAFTKARVGWSSRCRWR